MHFVSTKTQVIRLQFPDINRQLPSQLNRIHMHQSASRMSTIGKNDVLVAISEGHGPRHYLIALVYAGWGAAQLDAEMRQMWLDLLRWMGERLGAE